MSDIKMSYVFKLPVELIEDFDDMDVEPTVTIELAGKHAEAAVHAINNHDKLTSRVAELEELLVRSIDRLNDCIAQDDAQAYKEAEKFIDIARKALKESE